LNALSAYVALRRASILNNNQILAFAEAETTERIIYSGVGTTEPWGLAVL